MKNYKVVIIGFGRFGNLLHQILSEHWTELELVVVSSRTLNGVVQQSLRESLTDADLVIPSVPISKFESMIRQIAAVLPPESRTVVVDVCSVKLYPTKVMQNVLPENIGILATHPMWGPDGTENGSKLSGLKFIYKIMRNNGNPAIKEFLDLWKRLGQEVIEMTPDEHDKQAAFTHAFAFLIGKIGIKMKIKSNQVSTKGFESILYNQQAVENDSGELFNNMFTYNPYARDMLDTFIENARLIRQNLYENI